MFLCCSASPTVWVSHGCCHQLPAQAWWLKQQSDFAHSSRSQKSEAEVLAGQEESASQGSRENPSLPCPALAAPGRPQPTAVPLESQPPCSRGLHLCVSCPLLFWGYLSLNLRPTRIWGDLISRSSPHLHLQSPLFQRGHIRRRPACAELWDTYFGGHYSSYYTHFDYSQFLSFCEYWG